MKKKSKKHIGLTNIVYKQPYELYLKTIKYNNVLKKSLETKGENSGSNEPLNTSIPMECPDKLYLIPQVSNTFECFCCLQSNMLTFNTFILIIVNSVNTKVFIKFPFLRMFKYDLITSLIFIKNI